MLPPSKNRGVVLTKSKALLMVKVGDITIRIHNKMTETICLKQAVRGSGAQKAALRERDTST